MPLHQLIDWDEFPPFDVITPAGLDEAVRTALADAASGLEGLEADTTPSWGGLVEPLERLLDPLLRSWGLVGHLLAVRNSDELRTVQEQLQPEVVRFFSRLGQSRPLYQGWCALRDGEGWAGLDEAQQRIVTAAIRDAEHAGVGLTDEARERFNANQEQLAGLTTEFSNHVLDATKAWSETITDRSQLDGLPASAFAGLAANARSAGDEGASAEDGPWRITLDAPSFLPVMQHVKNRDLRQRVYLAYVTRAADGEIDNTPLIAKILALRHDQAQLLGYNNYAELSLASKMAGSVDRVDELLEQLWSASRSQAEQDLADLKDLAAKSEAAEASDFQAWDQSYWAERMREQRYELKDEELRPYFSFERVLESLFTVCRQAFGVRIEAAAEPQPPVWHEDVTLYRVFDVESAEEIAAFYLDPFVRPEDKRPGAWMGDCVGRSRVVHPLGRHRRPVAYIICNQPPPVDDQPSLMTFRDVETLYHEMGHALQHMLTTVDHAFAAGIENIEWDAVELPSQFMEEWCYERPVLAQMAVHFETGEAMPDELTERLIGARAFRAGSDTLRQLHFAMTDLALHRQAVPDADGRDAFALEATIAERCSVLPRVPENRFLCSFSHIFAGGYAAGYFSYKWAEVLAADAFGAYESVDMADEAAVAAVGRRFRDTVLASGGGRHPMQVFSDFRGRDPSPEALLRRDGLLTTG